MRLPLLTLLELGPAHGYELKTSLESRFGEALPSLNTGQIYTSLQRLARDGLVQSGHVSQNGRPDKRVYQLTDRGHDAVREWLEKPTRATRLRDEFFMKLLLAASTGLADPAALIARQRDEYLRALRDLEDVRARAGGAVAASLLVEGAALHLEADLEWLALCEDRLTGEVRDGQHDQR